MPDTCRHETFLSDTCRPDIHPQPSAGVSTVTANTSPGARNLGRAKYSPSAVSVVPPGRHGSTAGGGTGNDGAGERTGASASVAARRTIAGCIRVTIICGRDEESVAAPSSGAAVAVVPLVNCVWRCRLRFRAIPGGRYNTCLLYTSPSPRDATLSRMPSSA